MSGSAATSTSSSGGSSLTVSNFMFGPVSLSVSPSATVKVTNKDSATHTASGGQFDTGNITQNQTKTFKAPSKPGTYHYICSIHQYMMGTIIVK